MRYVKQLTNEIEVLSEKFKTIVELYIDRELKEDENIHAFLHEDMLDFFLQIDLDDEAMTRITFTLPIIAYYDCVKEIYTYKMGALEVERETYA